MHSWLKRFKDSKIQRFKDSKDSRLLARVKDSKKFSGFWCFSVLVANTFVHSWLKGLASLRSPDSDRDRFKDSKIQGFKGFKGFQAACAGKGFKEI